MHHGLTLPFSTRRNKVLLGLGAFLLFGAVFGSRLAAQTCVLTTTGTCTEQCTVTVVLTDTGVDENGPCGTAHLYEVKITAVCGAATCGPTTFRRCAGSTSPVSIACNGHNVTDTPTTTWGAAFTGSCVGEQTATCS